MSVPLVVVAKSRFGERRALRMVESVLPAGREYGHLRTGEKTVKRVVPGTYQVEFPMVDASGAAGGKVSLVTMPGKRAYVESMALDRQHRGRGIGSQVLRDTAAGAAASKRVRRVNWLSAGNSSRDTGSLSGARAWRADDSVRYARGLGIFPGRRGKQVSPEARREVRRYTRRSRLGLGKPSEVAGGGAPAGLSDEAAEALRGANWVASVRGGDRSVERVGAGAALGVGAVAARRAAKARAARVAAARRRARVGDAAALAGGGAVGAGVGMGLSG